MGKSHDRNIGWQGTVIVWRKYPFKSMLRGMGQRVLKWRTSPTMRNQATNFFPAGSYRTGAACDPRWVPGGCPRTWRRGDTGRRSPGREKEDISLQLVNPRDLEIACRHKGETEEKTEGYYIRERVSGSMSRVVTLPADVTEDDAKASFKNGILEVRLKKRTMPQKSRIVIE